MAEIKKVYKNGTAYDVLNSDTVGSALTAGTGIGISSNTISNTGVTSVNGQTGDVTVDSGITKIFTLSSTSDLTTAQAAFDWIIAGNVSYIRIGGTNYIYIAQGTSVSSTFTGNFAFLHRSTRRITSSLKISKLGFQNIIFVVSSGTVTEIKQLTDLSQEVVSSLPSTPDANTIYFVTD